MTPTLNPVLHELAAALRFIGMRDRLRCPACRKVGTFKPHGYRIGRGEDRPVRRWLCKWCGRYWGPEGDYLMAFPNKQLSCWTLTHYYDPTIDDNNLQNTPEEMVMLSYGKAINPWRG